jgi:protein-disulfide isomerase
MNKLMLLGLVVVAACSPDNRNLERKVDDLTKKVDQLLSQPRGGAGAAPRQQRAEPDRAKVYAVPIEGDPVDGPADAKVTLVKAYDYACPYCEKVRDTMDELRKKYGNDLRIVFKQYVVHPQTATAPALAVCAANKQGKFLQMDALLWDKGFKARAFDKDVAAEAGGQSQKCWESATGCAIVNGFAQELGLNVDKFKADMKDCMALIQKDQRDLQALSVSATPSFFVNGRFLAGAMPIDNFVTLIDEELKKANEKIQAGVPAASFYQQVVLDKGLKTVEKPGQ